VNSQEKIAETYLRWLDILGRYTSPTESQKFFDLFTEKSDFRSITKK